MTITEKQLSYLIVLLGKSGVVGWKGAQQWMRQRGIEVASFEELTTEQASRLIASLQINKQTVKRAPEGKDDPW